MSHVSDKHQVQLGLTRLQSSPVTFPEYVKFPNGSYNTDVWPIRRGRYAEQMKRWLDVFPREQFLILDGDEFKADPYPALREVEKFLVISTRISKESLVKMKKGHWEFYCWYRSGEAHPYCQNPTEKGMLHPQVPEETITWLRNYFTPLNDDFFNMTGVKFQWNMTKI